MDLPFLQPLHIQLALGELNLSVLKAAALGQGMKSPGRRGEEGA